MSETFCDEAIAKFSGELLVEPLKRNEVDARSEVEPGLSERFKVQGLHPFGIICALFFLGLKVDQVEMESFHISPFVHPE